VGVIHKPPIPEDSYSTSENVIPVKMFKCYACGKSLRDEHTLKCHIKTVHGEKKLACPVCGKKFPHKGVLNAHTKTHSNTTFSCSVCKETFRDSSYFKKHVRAHSGNRPHVCNVCGKSYLQNSHLKVHISLHTNEKPFQCSICQKSFRLAKSFKEHVNMHNNIKKYKCSLCPYSSCFRKTFQAHVKNHNKKLNNKPRIQDKEDVVKRARVIQEQKTLTPVRTSQARLVGDTSIDNSSGEDRSVFLLVGMQQKDGGDGDQMFSIQDIETLDPLHMTQELSVSTQPTFQTDKIKPDEYRPLDLSIVPLRSNTSPTKLTLNLKGGSAAAFFGSSAATDAQSAVFDGHQESGCDRAPPASGFVDQNGNEFVNQSPDYAVQIVDFSSRPNDDFTVFSLPTNQSMQFEGRPARSPNEIDNNFLDYSVENGGRRRSVFLAEQLEYEHQGDMRVVDPAEVTG